MVQKIAQYKSFVQKGIGVKPEYPILSPPSNYCYIKPLGSFFILFRQQVILLIFLIVLKSIQMRRLFQVFQQFFIKNFVLFFYSYLYIIILLIFYLKSPNPYISIFSLIFETTNYIKKK